MNLLEILIPVAGLLLCWFLAVTFLAMAEDSESGLGWYAALYLVGCFALYLLVRIVHWAWVTPIPV